MLVDEAHHFKIINLITFKLAEDLPTWSENKWICIGPHTCKYTHGKD
jgi:hypothetical protein